MHEFEYKYKARVVRVVDADTVDCDVDLGFKININLRFRLDAIDAWEVRGSERPKGLIAKQWLVDEIEGKEITIKTIKDKKGKYGRYLVVLFDEFGRSYNAELVELGHAEWKDY